MTATQRPARRPHLLLTVLTLGAIGLCTFAMPGHNAAAATPGQALTAQPDARQQKKDEPALLTDEDINLIKVYEIKFRDKGGKPPRVDIPRKVVEEMLEKYRTNNLVPRGKSAIAKFKRADGHQQLRLMFDLRAREFY